MAGQLITFEALGQSKNGYLALPMGEGPWLGVVVIQEWWGLDNHIKNIADRFAVAGFVAIAPDLYDGQVAAEPDGARKLAMALVWPDALAVIQGAINLLVGHSQVTPKKVGVVGFCMGGGLTWHSAAKLSHVGAAAPFYGGGPELSDAEVAQIKVPVLAIFGERDQGVSPQVAQKRDQQMAQAGVPHKTIIYPNAEHAFFNDTRPIYHPEAAADAWQRVLTLFKQTLV
jgi:carboxymethylenebutenolidase